MKKLFLLSFVALVLGILSFTTPGSRLGGENEWLPRDFDPKTGVLLVQKLNWPQKQQRKIEEFMKQSYPYKYAFITETDVSDTAKTYPDKETYRFVVVSNYNTHIMHKNDPTVPISSRLPVGMFDFFFIDRQSNRNYPATGHGSSWAINPFKYMMKEILKDK